MTGAVAPKGRGAAALRTRGTRVGTSVVTAVAARPIGAGGPRRARSAIAAVAAGLAAICAVGAAPAAAAAAPEVWTLPGSARAERAPAAAGSGRTATVRLARRETRAVQIVVRAPAGGLTDLSLAVGRLSGPGGRMLPASAVSLYREHFVRVDRPSPMRGEPASEGRGLYGDALIPFVDPATGRPPRPAAFRPQGVGLAAGLAQPYLVDVAIPAGTPPGSYAGTFTVTSGEGAVSGTLTVVVDPITLPAKRSAGTAFKLWNAFDLSTARLLLEHGVQPWMVDPADQRRLTADGLAIANLGFWSYAQIARCWMAKPPALSEIRRRAARQAAGLRVFNYTADEIGGCTELDDEILAWGRRLHQAGVEQLIVMPPRPTLFDDGGGTGRSAVDIWVVLPAQQVSSEAAVAAALAKGDAVWSYTALAPDTRSPKWLLDAPPASFRMLPGFLNRRYGLTGVLYWAVDYWPKAPWTVLDYVSGDGKTYNGEGVLLYPGRPAGVEGTVASLRLKWIRDGLGDYEYAAILERCGQGRAAARLVASVAADWWNWSGDGAAIEAVRGKLADLVVRHRCAP